MHDDTPIHHESGPEITDLAARLDRLGELDRAEPDAGFEARLAAATKPGVVRAIGPDAHGIATPLRWALAAAACLALTVGGILVLRPAPAPNEAPEITVASIDAEIEGFLFIDDLTRDDTIDDALSAAEVYTSGAIGADLSDSTEELYLDLLDPEGGAS